MRVSAKMPEVFRVVLSFFVQDFPAPKQSSLGASAWRSLMGWGVANARMQDPYREYVHFAALPTRS